MSRYLTVLVQQLAIAERSIARLTATLAVKEDYQALLRRSGASDRQEDQTIKAVAGELQRWCNVKEHIHQAIWRWSPDSRG